MSELDEATLAIVKGELRSYMEIFHLTHVERLLICDAWEYSISQANMPDWIKNDGVEDDY